MPLRFKFVPTVERRQVMSTHRAIMTSFPGCDVGLKLGQRHSTPGEEAVAAAGPTTGVQAPPFQRKHCGLLQRVNLIGAVVASSFRMHQNAAILFAINLCSQRRINQAGAVPKTHLLRPRLRPSGRQPTGSADQAHSRSPSLLHFHLARPRYSNPYPCPAPHGIGIMTNE